MRLSPSDRLRIARIAAGFETAKAAADRFGWSNNSYTQHESGIRGLGKVAERYAAAFKVSPGWLLTGEGAGPGSDEASAESRELARIYTELGPDQRRLLLESARLYHRMNEAPAREREGSGPDPE